MSIGNTLRKYFSNHAETGERHHDLSLRTHYYKTTKDKALAALEKYFSASTQYELNSVSSEHGEISVYKKGKKAFIVGTVIMVKPYHTAIDFSVTTESMLPFDFGLSTKIINHLYEQLNKELPLISEHTIK